MSESQTIRSGRGSEDRAGADHRQPSVSAGEDQAVVGVVAGVAVREVHRVADGAMEVQVEVPEDRPAAEEFVAGEVEDHPEVGAVVEAVAPAAVGVAAVVRVGHPEDSTAGAFTPARTSTAVSKKSQPLRLP